MRIHIVLAGLLAATAVSGLTIVTPVLVHKDGEASATGYTGSAKDILVDGGAGQVTAWMTFQTAGVDMAGIAGGVLVLYVKDVEGPGTLRVHALTKAVTSPEIHMTLADIAYDAAALDSVALGTADIESVIQLDLTAALADTTTAFHGVALTSDDGFRATFAAKEGDLQPKLMLTHTVSTAASRWLTGSTPPGSTQGADNDMYLETTTGDVYQKGSGTWALTGTITGADGLGFNWRGAWAADASYASNDAVWYEGSSYITDAASLGDIPSAGRPWTVLALAGRDGTLSWTDGSGIVTTTANVGINVVAPSERLEVDGNLKVTGWLAVGGEIRGAIDASRVSGPALPPFTPPAPGMQYDIAQLLVQSYGTMDSAVVVSGPGVRIERIEAYAGGHRQDESGNNNEPDFVVDLYPSEAENLKVYFDAYAADPGGTPIDSLALFIRWLHGTELYRWNMHSFAPASYAPVQNSTLTRFTFQQINTPNSTWECRTSRTPDFQTLDDSLPSLDYPTESAAIEIDGVLGGFCPRVVVDTTALTVTFTHYTFEQKNLLYVWTRNMVEGGTASYGRANMSIIQLAPIDAGQSEYGNTGCYEVGRRNYYGCFPISYQLRGGYRMPETLREEVVVAYCLREDG